MRSLYGRECPIRTHRCVCQSRGSVASYTAAHQCLRSYFDVPADRGASTYEERGSYACIVLRCGRGCVWIVAVAEEPCESAKLKVSSLCIQRQLSYEVGRDVCAVVGTGVVGPEDLSAAAEEEVLRSVCGVEERL